MKRNELIALAIKYHGEYDLIWRAVKRNEKAKEVEYNNCLTILDDDYPACLLELKKPPLVLFYKGNKQLLNATNKIGIVGARKACDYALAMTDFLVCELKDRVVVSGLAKGIDGRAAVCAKRYIGILGCGIDTVYPYSNYDLFKKVEKTGLLISEYPYNVKPIAAHFPFRNRLIAALCSDLYVMQARLASGTMISVNEALDLGKNIYVLPFHADEEIGSGNNQLISEGADIITFPLK